MLKTAYLLLGIVFIIAFAAFALPAGNKNAAPLSHSSSMIVIKSSAFEENASIPSEYTCDGANVSPALSFSGVPEGAKSLALIMDDPDIPQSVKDSMGINVFVHWVVFNISPGTHSLEKNAPPPGVEGKNGTGKSGYTGPCPPDREHRYFFKLYALDATLALSPGATKEELEAAMEGHVIASSELVGRYDRPQNAAR